MARDITDDNFYVASGGKVPVKWTAPEVFITYVHSYIISCIVAQLCTYMHTYIHTVAICLYIYHGIMNI